MRSPRNSKPSVDSAPVVVTARTMKDAYKIVRDDYGEDAVILGTRTVNRRQELGLGHEREIEVTVQMPGAPVAQRNRGRGRPAAIRSLAAAPAEQSRKSAQVNQEIIREVARIEELVASIAEDHERVARHLLPYCDSPLAGTLVENGASPEAVNKTLNRFSSETGNEPGNRPAAIAWLTENLRASNCTWEEFYGCHAFLGEVGSGRSDLVVSAAGLLQGMGRRTLVLSLMPQDASYIKRLQVEAARQGFDAAVIKKESQLAASEKHLSAYDVVLVDMPQLRHEVMAEGGAVHSWLAHNTSFHRHLLVPLDKDPGDMGTLTLAARVWNCDWIAVTRTDLSTRTAKVLDLLEQIPLPMSLISANPAHGGSLEIAHSDKILDEILGRAPASSFTRGVSIAEAPTAEEVAW